MSAIPEPYADHVGSAIMPEPQAIDLWFATGSTYTYFNVMRLVATEAATGVRFRLQPLNLRAIFASANYFRSRRARRRLPICGTTRAASGIIRDSALSSATLPGKKFGSHQPHCFVGDRRRGGSARCRPHIAFSFGGRGDLAILPPGSTAILCDRIDDPRIPLGRGG